jgi:phage tail P2-like protein
MRGKSMSEITPLNDISSKVFDELFSRFQDLDTDALLVYLIDSVDESALVHLADQFHIMGNEGWLQAKTEAEKREIIKKAVELHRYKGTKYALIKVLNSLNINGDVEEWFEYGGDPYHFKIDIFLQNYTYNEKVFESLKKMIDEYKNVRSVLEEISIESQFDTTGNWLTYTNAENEIMIG